MGRRTRLFNIEADATKRCLVYFSFLLFMYYDVVVCLNPLRLYYFILYFFNAINESLIYIFLAML